MCPSLAAMATPPAATASAMPLVATEAALEGAELPLSYTATTT